MLLLIQVISSAQIIVVFRNAGDVILMTIVVMGLMNRAVVSTNSDIKYKRNMYN